MVFSRLVWHILTGSRFTSFATILLHNPSFEWTISTQNLRVTALGTNFDGVTLSKNVSFKAFNNLPGVTISNFQLPADDPAGGIHIETDSLIPSPARSLFGFCLFNSILIDFMAFTELGIDLGTVGFQASFENATVGREFFSQ